MGIRRRCGYDGCVCRCAARGQAVRYSWAEFEQFVGKQCVTLLPSGGLRYDFAKAESRCVLASASSLLK